MTPDQRRLADAYVHVFASSPQTQMVLDDLTVAANAIADPLGRAGATHLILHMLLKRSAIRREKMREPKA